jgi:hypothetical protein
VLFSLTYAVVRLVLNALIVHGRANADYQGLDQEPEQVVEEGVEHDRGSIAGQPAGR